MYAIVEIAGQQFKVEKKQHIYVNRLEGKEGSKVSFSDVLLIDNNGKVKVGTPVISGAVVSAKILEHMQGDKVLVFKKKRRKGYQKLNGHRQQLTKVVIENILEKAPKAAAAKTEKAASPETKAKKADKPAAKKSTPAKATADKKAAPKAETPASAKAAAGKKAATKAATPASAKATAGKKTATKAETQKAGKPASAKATAGKKAAPKKTASKPKAASKAKKAGDDKKDKE